MLSTVAGNEEALKNDPLLRGLRNYEDGNNVLALSGGSEGGAKAATDDRPKSVS